MEENKELDYLKSLTNKQCKDIVYGDMPEEYSFSIVVNKQVDSTRWLSKNELILKEEMSNKHFRTYYQKGLTEIQDTRPFEEEDASWEEVIPVVAITTKYKSKENK